MASANDDLRTAALWLPDSGSEAGGHLLFMSHSPITVMAVVVRERAAILNRAVSVTRPTRLAGVTGRAVTRTDPRTLRRMVAMVALVWPAPNHCYRGT